MPVELEAGKDAVSKTTGWRAKSGIDHPRDCRKVDDVEQNHSVPSRNKTKQQAVVAEVWYGNW